MSSLAIYDYPPEGILHILLPNEEIDLAIADAGCHATQSLSIERMRGIVSDLSMAVSMAIAADSEEFELSVRSLGPMATVEEREFAARYHEIGRASCRERV